MPVEVKDFWSFSRRNKAGSGGQRNPGNHPSSNLIITVENKFELAREALIQRSRSQDRLRLAKMHLEMAINWSDEPYWHMERMLASCVKLHDIAQIIGELYIGSGAPYHSEWKEGDSLFDPHMLALCDRASKIYSGIINKEPLDHAALIYCTWHKVRILAIIDITRFFIPPKKVKSFSSLPIARDKIPKCIVEPYGYWKGRYDPAPDAKIRFYPHDPPTLENCQCYHVREGLIDMKKAFHSFDTAVGNWKEFSEQCTWFPDIYQKVFYGINPISFWSLLIELGHGSRRIGGMCPQCRSNLDIFDGVFSNFGGDEEAHHNLNEVFREYSEMIVKDAYYVPEDRAVSAEEANMLLESIKQQEYEDDFPEEHLDSRSHIREEFEKYRRGQVDRYIPNEWKKTRSQFSGIGPELVHELNWQWYRDRGFDRFTSRAVFACHKECIQRSGESVTWYLPFHIFSDWEDVGLDDQFYFRPVWGYDNCKM